ncbi:3-oxoacyl-acyl-carrier-protein reductase, partial [Aphelenchoides avenae]
SSGGIGQDVAVSFAIEGASVVIHGRCPERIASTEQLLRDAGVKPESVLSVCGDLSADGTPKRIVDETVAKFGRIDVLVNNAGTLGRPDLGSDSLQNFDFIFKVNLRSVVELTQLAMPYLEASGGNVINVSSNAAHRPFQHVTFYSVSKAALDHYTRNASLKYGPKVRVNSVNPGPVRTAILDKCVVNGDVPTKFEKWIHRTSGLNRAGVPPEVTSVIKFLASHEAAYVTGACWVVDGAHEHFTLPMSAAE